MKIFGDDFHFDLKNENEHNKKDIKNIFSKQFIEFNQSKKCEKIFLE